MGNRSNSNNNVVLRGFDVVQKTLRRLSVKQGGILDVPQYIDPTTGALTDMPVNFNKACDAGITATGVGATQHNINAPGAVFMLVISNGVVGFHVHANIDVSWDNGTTWSTSVFTDVINTGVSAATTVVLSAIYPGASALGGGTNYATILPPTWRWSYIITGRTTETVSTFVGYVL